MMQTRTQRDLALAEAKVREVKQRSTELQSIYESLSQSFPVMVRTCGLCQTIVFHKDKSSGDEERAEAHRLLLEHVQAILGVNDAVAAVRDCDTVHYMLYTRRVLAAWIYFKRFSVSLLEGAGKKRTALSGVDRS